MDDKRIAQELVAVAKVLTAASYGNQAALNPSKGEVVLMGEFDPPVNAEHFVEEDVVAESEVLDLEIRDLKRRAKKIPALRGFRVKSENYLHKGGKWYGLIVLKGRPFDLDKMTSEMSPKWQGIITASDRTAKKDNGRFFMEWYKSGKRKRKYYKTLEEAKKVADKIFKQTGIMMGIEEDKSQKSSSRTSSDPELQAVADVVEEHGFMGSRVERALKAIGMRNIDFNTYDPPMPGAMWKMKSQRGKKIVIVNKRYVNLSSKEIVVGDIAIGYM